MNKPRVIDFPREKTTGCELHDRYNVLRKDGGVLLSQLLNAEVSCCDADVVSTPENQSVSSEIQFSEVEAINV